MEVQSNESKGYKKIFCMWQYNDEQPCYVNSKTIDLEPIKRTYANEYSCPPQLRPKLNDHSGVCNGQGTRLTILQFSKNSFCDNFLKTGNSYGTCKIACYLSYKSILYAPSNSRYLRNYCKTSFPKSQKKTQP